MKTKEFEQLKHLSTKIQEVTSLRLLEKPGTQGAILACIDGFTDEPVVQCDVQVVIW